MDKITIERLKAAGWHKNRKIDISVFCNKYSNIGMKMPLNISNFLEEFGMLTINAPDKRYFDVQFNPLIAIGTNLFCDYFEECLLEYGIKEMVYPIGVARENNLLILMTQNDVVYCFMDGCVLEVGTCVEEMLDCLVGECKMPRFIY